MLKPGSEQTRADVHSPSRRRLVGGRLHTQGAPVGADRFDQIGLVGRVKRPRDAVPRAVRGDVAFGEIQADHLPEALVEWDDVGHVGAVGGGAEAGPQAWDPQLAHLGQPQRARAQRIQASRARNHPRAPFEELDLEIVEAGDDPSGRQSGGPEGIEDPAMSRIVEDEREALSHREPVARVELVTELASRPGVVITITGDVWMVGCRRDAATHLGEDVHYLAGKGASGELGHRKELRRWLARPPGEGFPAGRPDALDLREELVEAHEPDLVVAPDEQALLAHEAAAPPTRAGLEELVADARVVAHAEGDVLDVGAHRLAHRRHRVDEGDLGGEEGVGGVLDRLGGGRIGDDHRSGDAEVQRLDSNRRGLVLGSDDDAIRVEEVVDGRALAEELRVRHDGHVAAPQRPFHHGR